MEMNVRDDKQLVEIWLTNTEKKDLALREALTAEREVLCDDCKTPTRVAVPYVNNVRFALAPAFSIVCIENIDGKPYAVIGRNHDGMPFVLKSWKNEEHI